MLFCLFINQISCNGDDYAHTVEKNEGWRTTFLIGEQIDFQRHTQLNFKILHFKVIQHDATGP